MSWEPFTSRWLFPRAAKVLRWSRWLDSQSAPQPGEPDRRCDTIAELVHREGLSHPRALVIELFTQADAEALDRTGEYLWRFRRELRHGPHGQDKYPFLAALLFLTGRCAEREVEADLPDEADVGNILKPRILELAGQDAVAFLDAVDQNRLTDSRLVWKPLPETITMNESILWREIRTKARLEERRQALMEVLRTKLSGAVLERATVRVEQQEDLDVLSRWFKQALTLSLEDLVAELDK